MDKTIDSLTEEDSDEGMESDSQFSGVVNSIRLGNLNDVSTLLVLIPG